MNDDGWKWTVILFIGVAIAGALAFGSLAMANHDVGKACVEKGWNYDGLGSCTKP